MIHLAFKAYCKPASYSEIRPGKQHEVFKKNKFWNIMLEKEDLTRNSRKTLSEQSLESE